MEQIITRFPPSPTGYLHVGGARTALFNWLYARNTKGKFILRIEDTDAERSTQASVDAILNSLEWLGIDWDQGPYFQSQRTDIHKQYIQKLIDSGHAYYCTCTPEQVEEMRQKAIAQGENPKYDGTCRDKGLDKSPNAVVRFKAPITGSTIINDIIRKNITVPNSEIDDFIIQRSDGSPMYNLAVVVDDITMGINTIIRGDDHISNTPKQILLYKALNASLPQFGHVPMVLGKDKSRLSKRHGAMSVLEYKEMGYLPDAVINYLVRLGWSYGDQEFFKRDELIEKFTLKNIGRSAGVFDPDKLLALNADHIKACDPKQLISPLSSILAEQGYNVDDKQYLEKIIKTLNLRSKTLLEMADGAQFYLKEIKEYDEKASKKIFKQSILDPMIKLANDLANLDEFDEPALEQAFKSVLEHFDIKFGKIAQPVRLALTGKTVSPGIFETIETLGKEKTVARLNRAVAFIRATKAE